MRKLVAAAQWPGAGQRRSGSAPIGARPKFDPHTSLLVVMVVATSVASGIFARGIARGGVEQAGFDPHAVLRQAVDDDAAEGGRGAPFDSARLQRLARRSGLHDLHFDTDTVGRAGRQTQSLLDDQGRIIGWFSWTASPANAAAKWRWAIVATICAVLALCAWLAAGAMRRQRRALRQANAAIRKLTQEDGLTGLPNHGCMLARLDAAIAPSAHGVVALIRIDLDGFREVNDVLGRAGGDGIIVRIAEQLKKALPPEAEFGRFEDDEFAVIVTSEQAPAGDPHRLPGQALSAIVESLRGVLASPIVMNQVCPVSACLGVAQALQGSATGATLVRHAGLALRAAKRAGRGGVRWFEPTMETQDSNRRSLRRQLETAIAENALDIHYQPLVAAERGKIIGVEALTRWHHPVDGEISPAVFIPLAEESGLMSKLGEWVLRRALSDGVRWPDLSIAVNLSPLQIRDRHLVETVAGVLAETGIAASRIVLEVTEGVLIDDPDQALIQLDGLRGLGVRIALDDFGTGYSSLSYLQKFPFSQLKIDRAFVSSLKTSGHAGAIIQSIVTLGHALGMKVLAEGVETDEQRVLLRLAGCDEMQGFLFARPQPAEAIARLLSLTDQRHRDARAGASAAG